MDIVQILAAVEGPLADFHQGIAKVHRLDPVAAGEGAVADLGNAAGEHHVFYVILVLQPGSVGDLPAAGDGQGVAVQ